MNWQPIANGGIKRTVSSEDLPDGLFLFSYRSGPWTLGIDCSGVESLSIDQLTEIVQKLKQLNERDTHAGRDTYRERAEEQIPGF